MCRWKKGFVHVLNSKSFLVTEAERKHVRRRAQFQQHETRAVINSFFLQGKAPKEIHAILTENRTGWSILNMVIFPPVMRLVLDDLNSDDPGDY